LVPLARLERHGKSTLRTAIVVRKDSPYERMAELEGARFAYGNPVCAASRLVPRAMFHRAGLDPERDFFEARTLGSNENALYAVAADMFDATAVDESSARPFLRKGILRVLTYSRPIPQYLLAASPEVPPEQRQRLTAILSALAHPGDGPVLDALGDGVEGFRATEDAPYDVIRTMARRHLPASAGNGEDRPEAGGP
jgi:phosphonate transport system substrate-binding protein